MKTMMKISLFAVAAFALIGCAPPANTSTNANVNTNANIAAKPAMPSADTLLALDNKAWEAYKNKDGKYFEGFLGDTVISGTGEGTMSKADVVKMIAENKDDIKSFSLTQPHVTPIGSDAVVLTYRGTLDGTKDGKALPSPLAVATVFVRTGSEWKAVYHEETVVIEAQKAAADSNSKSGADSNKGAASADKKDMTSPEAVVPPSNSNASSNKSAASNSNSSASSADAALTDALMVLEKKGWEGWKAKDPKALDEVTAKDFAFVRGDGVMALNKADAMKMWTTDNKCEVSSVSLSDGKAVSIGKDAAILVVKGTAVGTCDGMKLEPIWNTTVFVKEGDTWKAAYIFEKPMRKS